MWEILATVGITFGIAVLVFWLAKQKEGFWSVYQKVQEIVEEVVYAAEQLGNVTNMTGAEKKAFVKEKVNLLLEKFNWKVPEWIIDLTIEAAVGIMNINKDKSQSVEIIREEATPPKQEIIK